MRSWLALLLVFAAIAGVCETTQSIPVAAGSAGASWTNTGSRVYLNRIIYTMSEAATTNDTVTFAVTLSSTGSISSNDSAVVVTLDRKVLVDLNTVVTVGRTQTNATGNAVLVFE